MKRVSDMPLYIKQLVYESLLIDMKSFGCDEVLRGSENFSSFVPTLTYKGETELENKTLGFDGNIHNFLKLSKDGYNIAEISVNTFLTLEEVAKLFVFCIDENLLQKPDSKSICAVAEYLSGKTRLGEYLVSIGKITKEQLDDVLKTKFDNKFGDALIGIGLVKSEDIKAILKLKDEAQKRFILDFDTVPKPQITNVNSEKQADEIISQLKSENKKLKAQLNKLLEIVK